MKRIVIILCCLCFPASLAFGKIGSGACVPAQMVFPEPGTLLIISAGIAFFAILKK